MLGGTSDSNRRNLSICLGYDTEFLKDRTAIDAILVVNHVPSDLIALINSSRFDQIYIYIYIFLKFVFEEGKVGSG